MVVSLLLNIRIKLYYDILYPYVYDTIGINVKDQPAELCCFKFSNDTNVEHRLL